MTIRHYSLGGAEIYVPGKDLDCMWIDECAEIPDSAWNTLTNALPKRGAVQIVSRDAYRALAKALGFPSYNPHCNVSVAALEAVLRA